MKKSGLADSPFFHVQLLQNTAGPASPKTPPQSSKKPVVSHPHPVKTAKSKTTKQETKRAKPEPRPLEAASQHPAKNGVLPRYHDTVVAWYHDTMVEAIRAAVKQFGKEAATHRWTPEEKKAVADIIYAYKGHNIRTSENEIARIAVNFVVEDYRENGENSIIHKVLKALNG